MPAGRVCDDPWAFRDFLPTAARRPVWKTSLIARLGLEQAEAALKEANVDEFDVTGRPMKGWVMVDAEGVETDQQLSDWIEQSIELVSKLPKK